MPKKRLTVFKGAKTVMKMMGQPGRSIGPYNLFSYENSCEIIAAKSSGLCPTQISSTFNIPVRNILLSFESYSIMDRRLGSGRKRKLQNKTMIK